MHNILFLKYAILYDPIHYCCTIRDHPRYKSVSVPQGTIYGLDVDPTNKYMVTVGQVRCLSSHRRWWWRRWWLLLLLVLVWVWLSLVVWCG